MKTYTFHIRTRRHKTPWYEIELREDQSLDDLNNAIQDALGWDNDHLYSFSFRFKEEDFEGVYGQYMEEAIDDEEDSDTRKAILHGLLERNGIVYLSPNYDEDLDLGERSAETKLGELRLKEGDFFGYLFDFGDEHRFVISVLAEGESEHGKRYPAIVGKAGRGLKQYNDED